MPNKISKDNCILCIFGEKGEGELFNELRLVNCYVVLNGCALSFWDRTLCLLCDGQLDKWLN